VARRTGGRARQPAPAPVARPAPGPEEAIDYVNDYYERARDLLLLKTMVEGQAIEDAKRFGDLKDPPSISAAVSAEIFSQVIGLIPGCRFVTAAVEGALFARELSKLKSALAKTATNDVIEIPGYRSPAADRLAVFNAVATPRKLLAVFEGGSHSIFTDRSFTGGPALNPKVKTATAELTLAFLDLAFDGNGTTLARWNATWQPILASAPGAAPFPVPVARSRRMVQGAAVGLVPSP